MGMMSLLGMMEMQNDIRVTLDWHLRSNMYPPVPSSMVDVCVEAIDATNADVERSISLPDGVTWRGLDEVPSVVVMEEFRLWPFAEGEEF